MVLIAAGMICLALGSVGIFLPVLPTTPFVLLAAFFFARGSPRLHRWLLRNPVMGRMIRDWQRNGVIRLRPKLTATAMMVLLCSYTVFFVAVPVALKAAVVTCCALVLVFIWSRPSAPAGPELAAGKEVGA